MIDTEALAARVGLTIVVIAVSCYVLVELAWLVRLVHRRLGEVRRRNHRRRVELAKQRMGQVYRGALERGILIGERRARAPRKWLVIDEPHQRGSDE